MRIEANRFRGTGLCAPVLKACPSPSVHVSAVMALLARCPAAMKTPLVSPAALARDLGVATIDIKDERNRMGLGSFKALGAA